MRNLVVFTLFVLIHNLSFCQEIVEPELTDVFYFWNKEGSELIKMSEEDFKTIPAPATIVYKFSGPKSINQITSSKVSFIINAINPVLVESIAIYKLQENKKSRKVNLFLVTPEKNRDKLILYGSKVLKNNVVELELISDLEPGEYGCIYYLSDRKQHSFTFSIKN